MENIYNHNISINEIRALSKMIPGRRIDNKYKYINSLSDDLYFADLFRLYLIRGDEGKAESYLNKIEDSTLKYFLSGN
jgi:hypothetical protein